MSTPAPGPVAPRTLALLQILDALMVAVIRADRRLDRMPVKYPGGYSATEQARAYRVQDHARAEFRQVVRAVCQPHPGAGPALTEFGEAADLELADLGRANGPAVDAAARLAFHLASHEPVEHTRHTPQVNWHEPYMLARNGLLRALHAVGRTVPPADSRRYTNLLSQDLLRTVRRRTVIEWVRAARIALDGETGTQPPDDGCPPAVLGQATTDGKIEAEQPVSSESAPPTGSVDPCAYAMSLVANDPRLTIDQVAAAVGVGRQRLYDSPRFEKFRVVAVSLGLMTPRAKRGSARVGFKTKGGRLEAYADQDD